MSKYLFLTTLFLYLGGKSLANQEKILFDAKLITVSSQAFQWSTTNADGSEKLTHKYYEIYFRSAQVLRVREMFIEGFQQKRMAARENNMWLQFTKNIPSINNISDLDSIIIVPNPKPASGEVELSHGGLAPDLLIQSGLAFLSIRGPLKQYHSLKPWKARVYYELCYTDRQQGMIACPAEAAEAAEKELAVEAFVTLHPEQTFQEYPICSFNPDLLPEVLQRIALLNAKTHNLCFYKKYLVNGRLSEKKLADTLWAQEIPQSHLAAEEK